MTDNEKDIGRLEGRVDGLESRVDGLERWMASIDAKVDQLLAAAHVGRGAWLAMAKLGGVLTAAGAVIAWVWDNIPLPKVR